MQEAQSGEKPRQFFMANYNMTGYGDVSHGRLNKHGLYQVSGPLAHEVLEVIKNRTIKPKCTRLDTKMSIVYGEKEWKGATRRLTQEAWTREAEGGLPQTALTLYEGAGKGDTLYFGNRDDASFARIYQANCKHPERYPAFTISAEVQHNEKTANTIFNMMRSSANMHLCAGSSVVGKLLSYGVREPWFGEIPPSHVMQRKHKSEKESTLRWVKHSVRGSFRRAVREGWHISYLAALGLDVMNEQQAAVLSEILERFITGEEMFSEEF